MSIYISGLEFPKVPTFIILLPDGKVEIPSQARMEKAMPVPEHGDLIDRNETVKTLAHDYAYAAADIVRDEMPTIIPADKVKEETE